MKNITKISENKGLEIPKELITLCNKVLNETIKLGSESSEYFKNQAQKWLDWLRNNNIEGLEVENCEGINEVWNILLCIKYDEI